MYISQLSLPAHLDLSGSSTGDNLSPLPFCKEPGPASQQGGGAVTGPHAWV